MEQAALTAAELRDTLCAGFGSRVPCYVATATGLEPLEVVKQVGGHGELCRVILGSAGTLATLGPDGKPLPVEEPAEEIAPESEAQPEPAASEETPQS